MPTECPVCRSEKSRVFFELNDVPVSIGVQWPTVEQARNCRKGDLHLACCSDCGFIWNTTFDATRLEYSRRYDNSLDFSPTFQRYAFDLARRLIDTYDIRNKDVVEIGCGKGHFLSLLCEEGGNRGIGFDPSYDGMRAESSAASKIRYIQDFYGEKHTRDSGDLICSRHVFEHIEDPVAFLADIRKTIGGRSHAVVYFEVPDVRFILEKLSVWDIIYEHCNYFGRESLQTVFSRQGFEVLRVDEGYGGQFLSIEARLAGEPDANLPLSPDLAQFQSLVTEFARRMEQRQSNWRERLERFREDNCRVVIWGGGSKAVSFLNMLAVGDTVPFVVDINPNKQGLHMPGTGQRIVSPDDLKEFRPDVVVLMNPMYRGEVQASLEHMGLRAEMIDV